MYRLIGLLLITLLSAVTATPAHAASCFPFSFTALPNEGAAVPRNAHVWLPTLGDSQQELRWHDTEGVAVAFSMKRLPIAGGRELVVLSPEALLRHPATYEVEACGQDHAGMERCSRLTTFSTLDEIDEEPPALPQVEEWMRSADEGDFGKQRMVFFTVAGDALVLADADGEGLDSPLEDDGAQLAALSKPPHVGIGYGACTPRNIQGDQADVRFGTFDLAGNFSGYTEPRSVKLPELDGCALAARRGGGWMALLGLIALLHRRRQRHAHS